MAVALPVNAADDEIIQEVIVTGSLIPMNLEAPGVPVTIMTSSDKARRRNDGRDNASR